MPAGAIELWQYTDGSGAVVVVDALEKVPAAERAAAKKVVLTQHAPSSVRPTIRDPEEAWVHWPSFGAGVVVALALAVGTSVVWSHAKWILKLAAVVLIAAALGGVYLGWVRERAGLGAGLASPETLVDDAQQAADQAKKMIDKQQRELRKIESR